MTGELLLTADMALPSDGYRIDERRERSHACKTTSARKATKALRDHRLLMEVSVLRGMA